MLYKLIELNGIDYSDGSIPKRDIAGKTRMSSLQGYSAEDALLSWFDDQAHQKSTHITTELQNSTNDLWKSWVSAVQMVTSADHPQTFNNQPSFLHDEL